MGLVTASGVLAAYYKQGDEGVPRRKERRFLVTKKEGELPQVPRNGPIRRRAPGSSDVMK